MLSRTWTKWTPNLDDFNCYEKRNDINIRNAAIQTRRRMKSDDWAQRSGYLRSIDKNDTTGRHKLAAGTTRMQLWPWSNLARQFIEPLDTDDRRYATPARQGLVCTPYCSSQKCLIDKCWHALQRYLLGLWVVYYQWNSVASHVMNNYRDTTYMQISYFGYKNVRPYKKYNIM